VNREKRREVRRLAKLALLNSINNSNSSAAADGTVSNVTTASGVTATGAMAAATAGNSGAAAAAAAAAAGGGGGNTTSATYTPQVMSWLVSIISAVLVYDGWFASTGHCMLRYLLDALPCLCCYGLYLVKRTTHTLQSLHRCTTN
jgi:hypothetical protein